MRQLILIAAFALSSGTGPAQGDLAHQLAGYVAEAPKTCISSYQAENLRIIDNKTLAYGSGRIIYVNKLPQTCHSMNQLNILQVNAEGSQYCRGDRIRWIEPTTNIPGPWCVLGEWTPYRMK